MVCVTCGLFGWFHFHFKNMISHQIIDHYLYVIHNDIMICVTFRFRLYLGTRPMVHVQMICRMGGHFFHQMLLVRLVPVPAGNIQIT